MNMRASTLGSCTHGVLQQHPFAMPPLPPWSSLSLLDCMRGRCCRRSVLQFFVGACGFYAVPVLPQLCVGCRTSISICVHLGFYDFFFFCSLCCAISSLPSAGSSNIPCSSSFLFFIISWEPAYRRWCKE